MRGKARFVPVSAAFDVLINEGRIYNYSDFRPEWLGIALKFPIVIGPVADQNRVFRGRIR